MTGKKKLAKAGKYSGGSQPFGYRWDDEKEEWVIREDEAKIVKLIFQWYVYGDESGQPLGMVRIAEKLTELPGNHIEDDLFNRMQQFFSKEEIMNLALAVAQINSWNRLVQVSRPKAGEYQVKV